MACFKGTYRYSVDEKGRVSIPVKLRKNLSEAANNTFTVTRGLDGCLFLYPHDEWLHHEKEVKERFDPYNSEDRKFVRAFTRMAEEVLLDKQQRVIIPAELLKLAGITADVVIVGAFDKIELWSPERFEKYMGEVEPEYEDVAAKVMGRR